MRGIRTKVGRHKWSGRGDLAKRATENEGGFTTQCVNCGCVREYVKGLPTYFIDDTLYDSLAPRCDGRLKAKT